MLPLKLEKQKTTNTEINSCIRGFNILIYKNLIRKNASFVDDW